jgi:DNA-binding transcriptional LysR family regulator
MNLSQMEIIHALVEAGSLRGAAKVLKKSESSLSVSIKKLESELGLKILDRSEYRAKLTEEGVLLFRQVSVILRATRTLRRISTELHKKKFERYLRIAIDPLLPPDYLRAILGEVNKVSSTTTVSFRYCLLATIIDDISTGRVSLAIAPSKFLRSDIESIPLLRATLVTAVSKSIYLESNQNEDLVLSQFPQVLVCTETIGPLNKIRISNIECHELDGPKVIVSDHAIKRALIKSGQGWGRVEAKDLKPSGGPELIELKSVPGGVMDLDLHLMRRADRPLGPVGRAIWQHFQASRV